MQVCGNSVNICECLDSSPVGGPLDLETPVKDGRKKHKITKITILIQNRDHIVLPMPRDKFLYNL